MNIKNLIIVAISMLLGASVFGMNKNQQLTMTQQANFQWNEFKKQSPTAQLTQAVNIMRWGSSGIACCYAARGAYYAWKPTYQIQEHNPYNNPITFAEQKKLNLFERVKKNIIDTRNLSRDVDSLGREIKNLNLSSKYLGRSLNFSIASMICGVAVHALSQL